MKDAAKDSTPTGGSSSKLKIPVISEKPDRSTPGVGSGKKSIKETSNC